MSDSVWPHRRQPTRLPHPWDSPGKNTGVGCHFLLQFMEVKSESEVAQSCPTLSDPRDCSPLGSSIHGIFQARVLEWGAIAFSNDKPRQCIKKHFADIGCSPQHKTGQWIQEMRCLDKENNLLRKLVDQEDSRLMSQSNHLVSVWMPDSFTEPEREKQLRSKVKRQKREGEAVRK